MAKSHLLTVQVAPVGQWDPANQPHPEYNNKNILLLTVPCI